MQTGPLIYAARANLPWGSGWNRSGQGLETSHLAWASSLPETLLATAVELPYATVGDAPVTPRSARAFGRDLACALRTFLEQRP